MGDIEWQWQEEEMNFIYLVIITILMEDLTHFQLCEKDLILINHQSSLVVSIDINQLRETV